MTADIHKKPFDEGTLAKLEIFEDYAEAWLPTFIMSGVSKITVFDLFAGQGHDTTGVSGSAIRTLVQIKRHSENIRTHGTKIALYLNEFVGRKLALLEKACQDFLSANPEVASVVKIHYSSEDFEVVFARLIPIIGGVPSLVYLDQNGIKAIAPKYFQQLAAKPQTDFLYFVSSSYFWRFGDSDEFKSHLDVDIAEAKKDAYRFIHRHVLNQIRQNLPADTKLRVYPFSIRKGANIHGIIFGATHPLAFDKFLRIAWKRNETNGEANFDIDDDYSKSQPDLWSGKSLTKREKFDRDVREKVLNGQIGNNSEALAFAYSEGHIGTHADAVLRAMKKAGEVWYEGRSPLVTYENVHKLRNTITYIAKGQNEQK